MVVLNIYSKIEPICISEKLGLYIDNIPDDWKSELKERIAESKQEIKKKQIKYGINNFDFNKYCKDILKDEFNENESESVIVDKIVEKMICIYFDFDYDDMPLGDWTTNCFDGRFCEEDYAEKVIDFINFAFNILDFENKTLVNYIYSSNYDRMQNEYCIFYHNENCLDVINTLVKWGELFDFILNNRNDYLRFDYILNAIHEMSNSGEFEIFKLYSLCQLFLEKSNEYELDWKLPYFYDEEYSLSERENISIILRKIRKKIAHGDFIALENVLEAYSQIAMVGFRYDYSEYSKRNWILLNARCLMEDIVRNLLKTVFYNNNFLDNIKKCRTANQFQALYDDTLNKCDKN